MTERGEKGVHGNREVGLETGNLQYVMFEVLELDPSNAE